MDGTDLCKYFQDIVKNAIYMLCDIVSHKRLQSVINHLTLCHTFCELINDTQLFVLIMNLIC